MKDFHQNRNNSLISIMLSAVQNNGGKGTYLQAGAAKASGHHCSDFDIDENSLLPAMELIISIGERFLSK